jgi:6,7-dimethyl-8-ribityllumazine synthase
MKKLQNQKATVAIPQARIAIIQSGWHDEHTDRIVQTCTERLLVAGCEAVDLHRVPGCYEIPFAAKQLAKIKRYDALIAVGAIIKGETDHYQVILDTCVRELGKVMYDFDIPVIMEILPVHSLNHLIERSSGEQNKGIEAAHAAAEIIAWQRQLPAR